MAKDNSIQNRLNAEIDKRVKFYEENPIEEGEILKIRPDGKLERHHFHYSYYKSKGWWEYDGYASYGLSFGNTTGSERDAYIDALKSIAAYQGVSIGVVDELLKEGFTPEEIEEYIYEFTYG